MKPISGLSASSMRIVFILLFVLSLAGFVSLYYFGNSYLTSRASELHNALTNSVSTSSSSSLDSRSKSIISSSSNLMTKINNIYVPSGDYQQTTSDAVRSFATKANYAIDTIDFQVSSANPSTKAFEIKTTNPVEYTSLINFLSYLEKALPKMQITKLNLSADKTDQSKVKVDNLTMEVFIK